MLLLTRRCGESIRIEDDVVVQVLKIKGNVVLLGVKAPRTVPVHREEVYEKIQQELHDKANEENTLEQVYVNDSVKSVLVRRKPIHKEKEENRLA